MATTLPRPGGPAADRGAGPAVVPGGRQQRRWSLALVAVLLTLGSALAFVVLWMNAGDRQPVLALANDVAAGQEITANDLKVVRVSADGGVSLVASSARDQVIGQPAKVNLAAGSLLVAEAVGDGGLESGDAVIAIPIPVTRLPTDLGANDRLTLYRTGGPGDDAGPATRIGEGTVSSVQNPRDATGRDVRVSVIVEEHLVPEIAAAVVSDTIYVARGSVR
jgi:hypothetical protein